MAEILNALLMIMANTGVAVGGTSSRLARAADLPESPEGILMMMLIEMPFGVLHT